MTILLLALPSQERNLTCVNGKREEYERLGRMPKVTENLHSGVDAIR